MNSFYTLITAHSGCDNTQPNTLDSIITGLKSGADFVEIDVRSTRDGIVVLYHDEYIESAKSGKIRICDLTFTELNELVRIDSLSDNRLPRIIRLEEAVTAVKDYGGSLNIDIKDDLCIDPLIKRIKEADMGNSTIFTGCKYPRALALKKENSTFQVLLNLDISLFLDANKTPAMIADEICRMAINASCCGINIEFSYLSEELIGVARKRYLPISIWTITEREDLDRYLNMGFYSITTLAASLLVKKRNMYIEKMAFTGI